MTSYDRLLADLSSLVMAYGVSGCEEPVMDAVKKQLPEPVVSRLKSDALGNNWVQFGPDDKPERLLIAHLDEIGLRITSIRDDGICRVQNVGGLDPQLWEGCSVLVHTAGGPVQGCIAPISQHVTGRTNLAPKDRLNIEDLLLDVGADSADGVASLGVKILDTATWVKQVALVNGEFVQARSLDDRFGCCALVYLAKALLVNPPDVPTALVWSVQEEVGLRGARAIASRFADCIEVIAIDSFTTGTGPRDNKQYDSAKLGAGPVLRSWDSTTLVPQRTRQQLLHKADVLGIELQPGFMPGGNDASVFEQSGARTFGLGVPLQYSHSQVERIHLRDLELLIELLTAWSQTDIGLD